MARRRRRTAARAARRQRAPVLLLHGHPRPHATWHRVAPLLAAAGHTVVCLAPRGYGRSSKPPTDAEHRPYSERAMAGDRAALMRSLGHERFAVVGHDRARTPPPGSPSTTREPSRR